LLLADSPHVLLLNTVVAPQIYIFRISKLASIPDAIAEYYDITARNIKGTRVLDLAWREACPGVGVPALAQYNSRLSITTIRICYETT
jgi:hypothetical protein